MLWVKKNKLSPVVGTSNRFAFYNSIESIFNDRSARTLDGHKAGCSTSVEISIILSNKTFSN